MTNLKKKSLRSHNDHNSKLQMKRNCSQKWII